VLEVKLLRGLQDLGLTLSNDALGKLLAYLTLLDKWNRTYNLTAIREPEHMVSHHLIDSLAVLSALPPGSLADVGSGGGLPGIPIAIAQPQRILSLNDSNSKKVAFLRQAKIQLGLHNVEVHAGRVEDWRPDPLFDVVISRAFSSLGQFALSCTHLVRLGGFLAAMKGVHPEAEVAALPPQVRLRQSLRLTTPGIEGERHLMLMQRET